MTSARAPGSTVAAVFTAGVVAALYVGKLPPSLPVLRDEFGIDLVQASLLVSMIQLAGMLLGLFGGMVTDRVGPRRTMRTGLLGTAAGGLLGAVAPDAATLLASRVLESAGFLMTVLPGPALLARSVPAERLRGALGLWGAYLPAGFALALLAVPIATAVSGWRWTWGAIALASLVMAIGLGRVVPADPPWRRQGPALGLVGDTVRSSRPWLLAAAFACYAAQWIGVTGFLPTLYAESGVPLALAGALTAIAVAVNVAGNVAAGVLLQRGVPRAVLVAATAVAMAAGAWLCYGSDASFALRYAGVLVFCTFGGLIPGTLFASVAAYAPHPRAVGTTTGLMQQGSAVAQFLAPPLVAAVVASAGGWHATWWVTAGFAFGDLLLAVLIARVDRRDHPAPADPGRRAH